MILGVGVSPVSMREALDAVDRWIAQRQPHYACVTSVHGVMGSQRDAELRRIHNAAGTSSPPFRPLTPEEDARIVRTIDRADPDIVWVGFGTPKQERWMATHVGLKAPC